MQTIAGYYYRIVNCSKNTTK